MIARKKKELPAVKTKTRQPLPPAAAPKKPPVVRGVKPLTIEIDIEAIDAKPFNPRTAFDQAELESLAKSLEDNGMLQPPIVRMVAPGRFELIAGGRRLKAAQLAGWKTVPALVRNATDEDAITWALIENLDRADLNPVEVARGVNRLCKPKEFGGCGMSQVEAGETMGREAGWVRRQIRLLQLPEIWLARIASGEISTGMGNVLAKYEDRPPVLAKIEDDMLANPWAWRTIDDFERNAAAIAQEGEAAKRPAVEDSLKPMRARPGESDKPNTLYRREQRRRLASTSVADDVYADGESSAEHVGDDVAAADPATSRPTRTPAHAGDDVDAGKPSRSTHAGDDVEGLSEQASNRVDVSQIVRLIGLVDDVAGLEEITAAVERRRQEISAAG